LSKLQEGLRGESTHARVRDEFSLSILQSLFSGKRQPKNPQIILLAGHGEISPWPFTDFIHGREA
jgi:hypothetical protein